MQYRLSIEELDDIPVTAASIEPMPKPDYRAKKHARPVRTACAVRDRGRRVWAMLDEADLT